MVNTFPLGRVVATRGVLTTVSPEVAAKGLARHARGDWGDIDAEDIASNNCAVQDGTRILSTYVYEGEPKFWVITEADRSVTTVLLPEEY